eukprot:CAMPEP_0202859646 /NCGR_PEP_ID=MMETSP1391-20130828/1669_1 /ASSEMBLY_ACC=CAM_ASM_000867 /TAXON_ID=1034604 /ORGANISM="Chlamydomonas leiostraca, Strain SAG 11-49" /LENGTH=524 /DNA_ID=CAMNT_0049538697 /DNA_START=123 /DNA_END=1697 /DNA_ORIENTATION=-
MAAALAPPPTTVNGTAPKAVGGRHGHSLDKEEVLKQLGRVLVLPVIDGKYRTPVVTLHNNDTSNLYSLVERQLRQDFQPGAEKWWKIIRTDQNLDTWRPRVHGTQLKALLNCRLPELPEEYANVEKTVAQLKFALRPDTSPEKFVSELRKFIAGVEVWWDNRNSRRPAQDQLVPTGNLKRPAASMAGPAVSSKQQPGGTPKKAYQPTPPAPPLYSQPSGLMRMPGQYSDSGIQLKDSPDDLFGNGGADFMPGPRQGGPGSLAPPLPSPGDSRAVVHLNVGGKTYCTSMGTLLSVPNTYFWDILGGPAADGSGPARTHTGEIFVDRNGKLFAYVLEYLRAVAENETFFPMPEDASELSALAREANFYGLPGLIERIQNTSIMPQAATRAVYDSIYLETGFNSIEGPSLKEMEQRKVVVMQQMNHVLAQKALDGFFVAACDCGVNHRDGPDGMQHNLFYHILLKKVTLHPMAHAMGHPMQVPPGPMAMPGGQQMHPGMQMPGQAPPAGGPMPLPLPMPPMRMGAPM